MPYIKSEKRKAMKKPLGDIMHQVTDPGDLNYVMYKMAKMYVKKFAIVRLSYALLNEVMGVYESSKAEFYRRLVAPYEDVKIIENGDIS